MYRTGYFDRASLEMRPLRIAAKYARTWMVRSPARSGSAPHSRVQVLGGHRAFLQSPRCTEPERGERGDR
eukprot:280597-Lingulodinium_polyedra.AAC.1